MRIQRRGYWHKILGEVKKWFRGVRAITFSTFQELEDAFITRWGEKKNPLQILVEYESLKIQPGEIVQDFSTRFNKFYNSILVDIKSPP